MMESVTGTETSWNAAYNAARQIIETKKKKKNRRTIRPIDTIEKYVSRHRKKGLVGSTNIFHSRKKVNPTKSNTTKYIEFF